ncbi:MAG TPA: translocation/assembly module TamB [Candidatus Coprenecus stercoravium]|uniref:Translocation/assembly module TamB n=1 Tax=Candidatus Coprenecus stercoravium TaxID=2840735 RepID=A0A9D2GQK6_9BACT|nr:translocation/assembly module TamB [Candidatus Coprenecus stercoravium]
MALQFPKVQNRIARRVVTAIEPKINGNIEVGRIAVVFFNKVMAYDVTVTGAAGDTLAAFEKLSVSLLPAELLRGRITANRIFIENGCFNLIKEGPGKYSNIHRILNLSPKPDSLKKPLRVPDMNINDLTLRNMRFSLRNPAGDTVERSGMMNFKNLNIEDIDARINRIRIRDNTIICRIRDISAMDCSGYELRSLSGVFSLNSSKSRIRNLHLSDTYSEIDAAYLSFGYNSGKDLKDFVHKITLGADFRNSYLDFRSLGYFAKALQGNILKLNINGEITGPVCNLVTHDLLVSSGDSTSVRIGASVSGLPDIENTYFNINFKEISTTTADVSGIVKHFSRKDNNINSILSGTEVTLRGEAYGTFSDIYSIGQLSSDAGKAGYEANLGFKKGEGMDISSSLWLENMDIGRVLSNDLFGPVDMTAGFHARLGAGDNREITANLDSLRISRININGYTYRHIAVTGQMREHRADIRLVSHDQALPAMFQGIVNFNHGNSPERARIFLDVPYSDLHIMNVVKKGEISSLGITAQADLRLSDKSVLGSVLLDNISYANDNGQYLIDSLYIRSAIMEGRNIVTVKSPILHADYSSTDSPARMINRLKLAVQGRSLAPVLMADTSDTDRPDGHYAVHLKTMDVSKICDILLPGLSIADNTTLDVRLSADNELEVKARSSAISYHKGPGKNYNLNGLMISASNPSGALSGLLSVDRLASDGFIMDNLNLYVGEHDSTLRAALSYHNADTAYLDLSGGARFDRDGNGRLTAKVNIDNSEINLRGHRWRLRPASVDIADRRYEIRDFGLAGESDTIKISGVISDAPNDKLSATIENIDLSVLNTFINPGIDLKGRLSGEIDLYSLLSRMGATMEIDGDGLSIFGKDLGHLSVLSRRDINRDRFNVLINNYIEDTNPINISGYYSPSRKYLNFNLSLNDLALSYLDPVLNKFADITGGTVSGDILVSGPADRLMFSSSNTTLDSLLLTPHYTQVPYIISGPVTMNQRSIDLRGLDIVDPEGSKAVLNGSMTHNFFKQIYLDANMAFDNFLCLNTVEKDNDKFYGTAYASGNVSLNGYTDNLAINADVATNDNSAIHIPLSSASSATTTDLISYTDFSLPEDSVSMSGTDSEGNQTQTPARKGNVEIRARASVSQGTELLIEMDKQMGDVLRCTGNGEIDLTLNPARNITDLRGDYTVSEGSYHFVVMSIQSRDFTLNEGGSISFNGDLMSTNLNIGATYSTKASISTLISDTTSVGNRRNVNCGIQIQGQLSNPEISFSIDIPDLDPITKGRVESALSTPDKVQKQFAALILSGSFVPDEQSTIVNNSTILYSNASEILSNQFNNIFRQFDIPLDLGLNYQPGTATGSKDMFDVAISYQAFNNRLIINGNVGNSETSSNWAGDFDAEIKVDKQGKLRVTLFTRSADSYSNYLDNTQRSGFGITYQDEFDSFGDFWRNIFFSRKRREEYELQLMKKAEAELEKEAAEANIVKEEIQKPKEDPMNYLESDPVSFSSGQSSQSDR